MKKLTVRDVARITAGVASFLVIGSVLVVVGLVWPIDFDGMEF